MPAERYFIAAEGSIKGDRAVLSGDEAKHILKVIRAREGDEFFLLDGKGTIYRSVVTGRRRDSVELRIVSSEKAGGRAGVDIAISMVKGPRMESAVEKVTELGIRRIIPFVSARSVWRGGGGGSAGKLARLGRKAEAACKQSGQPWFPEIVPIVSFEELVNIIESYGEAFIADPEGISPGDIYGLEPSGDLIGIVGPEGGLTGRERDMILEKGARAVSLGPARLRSETAATLIAFVLMSAARRR